MSQVFKPSKYNTGKYQNDKSKTDKNKHKITPKKWRAKNDKQTG